MRHTISLVVFFYVASAVLDAVEGIITANMYESYLFRFASVAAVIAAYVHFVSRGKPLRPLPFILTSLVPFIVSWLSGHTDASTFLNIAIKAASLILTIKPEIIEIEIITENEEKK